MSNEAWVRKSDGATVEIVSRPGTGSAWGGDVLARNLATGRSFWLTGQGLRKNYTRIREGRA